MVDVRSLYRQWSREVVDCELPLTPSVTVRLLENEEPVPTVAAAAAAEMLGVEPSPTNGVLVSASTTHNDAAIGSRTIWPKQVLTLLP